LDCLAFFAQAFHFLSKIIMTKLIRLFLLIGTTSPLIKAKDLYYDFKATPVIDDGLSPDCFSRRPMFLINGLFPGPVIEADEGDTIHVQLTNDHPSETLTIHFHGIHQKGSVYSDGVGAVTQCGLTPFQTQNLTFAASPSGTHFWHAHQSLLMADGITGALIVHPTENVTVPQYDEDLLVFLQDWYHTTSTNQRIGLDSEPFVWVGNPDTLLINGKGVFQPCGQGGTSCLTTCNDTAALLSRIQVQEGKTYRLRIINSAALLPFNFAIAQHNLTIIEADGTLVDPVEVENLDISPGQRYSVLLTANKPSSNSTDVYWTRITSRGRNVTRLDGTELVGLAVLDYGTDNTTLPAEGSEPVQPAWEDEEAGPALDAKLFTQDPESHEDDAIALTSNATTTYIMVGTQARRFQDNRLRWAVNNISNTPEPEPLIVKARRIAQADVLGAIPHTVDIAETPPTTWNYTDLLDVPGGPGIFLQDVMPLVLRLQKGDIVDIVMQNALALNGAAEVHPWHLHGHSFWIIGQGTGTYDPDKDPETFNLVNPVLRDTFTLWPHGWTAIRFHANNPGVWEFHCHILSHAMMGMGLSVVVSAEDVPEPPPGAFSCTEESLTSTAGDGSTSGSYEHTYSMVVSATTGLFLLASSWMY
jgi:L-ascorbate oxidase